MLYEVITLIPVAFALLGFLAGAGRLSPEGVTVDLDNQYRYFSGMYLVVAFLLWSIIPAIEKHGRTLFMIEWPVYNRIAITSKESPPPLGRDLGSVTTDVGDVVISTLIRLQPEVV